MVDAPAQRQVLPDYLEHGLDIVLVSLNPGMLSARQGRYFANPLNRFWKALNASGLAPNETFMPERDHDLPRYGIGLTCLVSRPSRGSSDLKAEDFQRDAPLLREKLLRFRPLIVCFQGLTVYQNYMRYAERVSIRPKLGLQERNIGASRVFVAPNPSPRNAVFSLDDLTYWYVALRNLRDDGKRDG